VRNVNISNTTNLSHSYVTNVYQNDVGAQHYMNETSAAVTAVPRNTFTSGQRVSGPSMPLSATVLAAAVVVAAAPAIVPTRQSVLGPGDSARVARPPAALLQRPVLARSPPPPAPAAFGRQLAALQENGGRPLTRGELAALQPATPLAPVRVVASRAPTAPTRAATVGSGATHPQTSVAPSLAERERALQQSILPAAAPRANVPARPAPDMGASAPPEAEPSWPAPAVHSDRPPSAQQRAAPPHAVVADDPGQAADRPPSMPVYHFPTAGDASVAPASAHSGETHRVPPPPPVPHTATPVPPPPPAHPPSARTPSTKDEPRDSAPHGDRDSRERVLR
jgi:hypothetical protein